MELIPRGGISGLSGIAGGGASAPATFDFRPDLGRNDTLIIEATTDAAINCEAVGRGGSGSPYGPGGGGGEWMAGYNRIISPGQRFQINRGAFYHPDVYLFPAEGNVGGNFNGGAGGTNGTAYGWDDVSHYDGGPGGNLLSNVTVCTGAGGGEAGQPTRAGNAGQNCVVGMTGAGGLGGTGTGSDGTGGNGDSLVDGVSQNDGTEVILDSGGGAAGTTRESGGIGLPQKYGGGGRIRIYTETDQYPSTSMYLGKSL